MLLQSSTILLPTTIIQRRPQLLFLLCVVVVVFLSLQISSSSTTLVHGAITTRTTERRLQHVDQLEKNNVRVDYATLKGELVPVTYKKRPMQAYGCFYGVNLFNCTCTDPSLPPSQGCYGPKCIAFDTESPKPQTLYKNYGCLIKDSNVLDCSQNDGANLYFFSNCTSNAGGSRFVNTSLAVDLYDYEFRFDSIELDRQHKVVTCPLTRGNTSEGSFLHGYYVYVKAHLHKIAVGLRDFQYVTQILECRTEKTVTMPTPLSVGSKFQQFVEIEFV